jgi:hypothetical protein
MRKHFDTIFVSQKSLSEDIYLNFPQATGLEIQFNCFFNASTGSAGS